jgi:serine/threonine protein kinase
MTDLIGKIFDRKYRLSRLIGEGGMGSVYEAEHTLIERKVAVKVMHAEFSSSEEVVNRFFREAQASSAIGHPNIIEIFDVGQEEDGTAFIVMELLKGRTLSSKLKEDGAMEPRLAAAVILQVLSALAASHEKGIIHRDLKPENVFLAVDNRGRHEVKLLDFGIAKIQFDTGGDPGLTKTGTVLGTPNYMSPEAARGKEIDSRSDIWAAGVMLYEMLSGRLPFQGSSYNEVLSEILLDPPEPIAEAVPGLSPEIVRIVEKAMEKDRDERYPDVSAMIQDLLPFIEDSTISDSAALALKNSIAPPAKNDETSPRPTLVPLSETGSPTLRELEFGPHALRGKKPRGRSHVAFLLFLLIACAAALGLTLFFKAPNQTPAESAQTLLNNAVLFLKTSVLRLQEEVHIPPVIEEPPITPEPVIVPDAGIREGDEPLDTLEGDISRTRTVTLRIENAPENARITLGGKPVEAVSTLPNSDKPVLLIVKRGKKKLLETQILLDKDRTISVKNKKRRTRGKKPKKSGAKKSSRPR